jgi:hypothetical protein
MTKGMRRKEKAGVHGEICKAHVVNRGVEQIKIGGTLGAHGPAV